MIVNGIHNCSGLIDYINKIGFLPLLRMGIEGWSAEEAVDDECRYVSLPEGGWESFKTETEATSSVRADAHTASSSTGRRLS